MEERAKIEKGTTYLLDNYYNNPGTSLLVFRFEPHLFPSSQTRLRNSQVQHLSLEGKSLYILDDFFLKKEGDEMKEFSQKAPFSRNSYGSPEAIQRGERPARSMNGRERWQFFSSPPAPIQELYKLFSLFGQWVNADVNTLPWELCDPASHGSPAVLANKIEMASEESMEWGKHQDSNPEGGISFAIPVLYSERNEVYPKQFENGGLGMPWLISVMVYTAADGFLPEYRMGTVFYTKAGKISYRADCMNMRVVLFESDLFHSIEASQIPDPLATWRISYVFKLMLNPREKEKSLKKTFFEKIQNSAPRFISRGNFFID